jgi:hypothetical protein
MEPPSTERPLAGYCQGYSTDVDTIREKEYPLLNGTDARPQFNKIVLIMTILECRDYIP